MERRERRKEKVCRARLPHRHRSAEEAASGKAEPGRNAPRSPNLGLCSAPHAWLPQPRSAPTALRSSLAARSQAVGSKTWLPHRAYYGRFLLLPKTQPGWRLPCWLSRLPCTKAAVSAPSHRTKGISHTAPVCLGWLLRSSDTTLS